MSPRTLARLSLCAAGLALGFLVGEATVRVLQSFGTVPRLAVGDLYPKPEHSARMLASQDPLLVAELDPADPLINDQGFRDRDFPLEKPPGTFRLLALGDSVTYGLGVPLAATWPKVLEERLRSSAGGRFEVLNFGASGYGTRQEQRLLETKARFYDPDVILVGYVLNDPWGPRFVLAPRVQRRRELYQRWGSWSQLLSYMWLSVEVRRFGSIEEAYEDPRAWRSVLTGLEGIAQIASEEDAAAVLIIFPRLVDFADYRYASLHDRVAKAARERGLPVLDLRHGFARATPESLRLQRGDIDHPNAEGHRLAAVRIHEYLLAHGLLDGAEPAGFVP